MTTDRTEGASTAAALDELRATVQERYGAVAQRVADGAQATASCCGPAEGSSGCCGGTSETWDPITADLYDAGETAGLPAEALLASLGCGNPTALAELRKGRRCSTSGPAAASTCCSRRGEWDRPARRTGWT